MEALIAVLILIGVLIVGGDASDKAPTRSGSDSAATTTLTKGEVQDRLACDDIGPRQRDLTVPYANRPVPASVDTGACDE